MGSKVNPNGLRFGVNKNWKSRWYAQSDEEMGLFLVQDDQIRTSLINKYKNAIIDRIEIERKVNSIFVFIYAGQPGVLSGNDNNNINNIKLMINKIVGRKVDVNVNIVSIETPELCARLVAREIADAIENRVSFRTAQKFAMKKVLKAGAKGVKTHVSGRLGGVEMAREEGYSQGIITLSTLRADIDYALEEAHTTYGIIGVKVWINRGEIFANNKKNSSVKKEFDNKKPRQNIEKKEFKKPSTNKITKPSSPKGE